MSRCAGYIPVANKKQARYRIVGLAMVMRIISLIITNEIDPTGKLSNCDRIDQQ